MRRIDASTGGPWPLWRILYVGGGPVRGKVGLPESAERRDDVNMHTSQRERERERSTNKTDWLWVGKEIERILARNFTDFRFPLQR